MSAEILAFLAAQLDPELARTQPAKAVELARNLLLAADPDLRESFDDERDQQWFEKNLKELHVAEQRFPIAKRISASEAFKVFEANAHYKDKYKLPEHFWAAMQKNDLTIKSRHSTESGEWFSMLQVAPKGHSTITEEATTREAVGELVKLKAEKRRRNDRKRKAHIHGAKPVNSKKSRKIPGNRQPDIGIKKQKKRNPITTIRNGIGEKRKIKIKR